MPHDQNAQSDDRADQEGQPPSVFRVDHVWIEEDDRAAGAHRGADPEAAVDEEIGPAPHPGRDQFLDRRIDRGVFAADAGAGQEAEQR